MVLVRALGTRLSPAPQNSAGSSDDNEIFHVIIIERNQIICDGAPPSMDANKEKSSFNEIWYQIFLYDLATSVFIHCIVALLSFFTLRRHKYGRFFPVLVIIVGFLYPITGGVISSAAISLVYKTAQIPMPNYAAFLWGGGQAFILFIISYTRILATL